MKELIEKTAKKPLSYWQQLANHYEKIINETKCAIHKRKCKSVLKEIIKPKIKNYETTK